MVLTSSPITNSSLALEGLESRPLQFYDKGEIVPPRENGCWQIYRGILQVSQWTAGGEEVLMGWAQPGGFVGLDLSSTEQAVYQIRALTDVYLRGHSEESIAMNAKLCQSVLAQTVRQLRQTEALLAIASYKRVEERLQELLQLLAQEMGEPKEGGVRLSVRFTHQMLANAIGTTRVTVTRLLGELQGQGKITLDGDRHLIIARQN